MTIKSALIVALVTAAQILMASLIFSFFVEVDLAMQMLVMVSIIIGQYLLIAFLLSSSMGIKNAFAFTWDRDRVRRKMSMEEIWVMLSVASVPFFFYHDYNYIVIIIAIGQTTTWLELIYSLKTNIKYEVTKSSGDIPKIKRYSIVSLVALTQVLLAFFLFVLFGEQRTLIAVVSVIIFLFGQPLIVAILRFPTMEKKNAISLSFNPKRRLLPDEVIFMILIAILPIVFCNAYEPFVVVLIAFPTTTWLEFIYSIKPNNK